MKTKEKTTAKKTYVLTVKMSPELGAELHQYARRYDTSVSDVVKNSVRKTMREGAITLEPVEYMTPKMEAYLAPIEDDIKHGRNIVATVRTKKELNDFFEAIERGEYAD